jgi:hypothetical protein
VPVPFSQVERREGLTEREFIQEYLRQRRPVVVTDGMRDWAARGKWTPEYLKGLVGELRVPLQGSGFDLLAWMRFGDYVDQLRVYEEGHLDGSQQEVPYLRWSYEDGGFTETLMKRVHGDWARPYFLPERFYLNPPELRSDPTVLRYPAFGVYVSPRSAVTRLHADDGITNAVLCQVYGRKRAFLMPPESASLFPDLKSWKAEPLGSPRVGEVYRGAPVWEVNLEPGDMLFIPACWLHEVYTLSTSVSLTYNFAHLTEFARYLPYVLHRVGTGLVEQVPRPGLRQPLQRFLEGYAKVGRRLDLDGF